jgi:hypothetical protein
MDGRGARRVLASIVACLILAGAWLRYHHPHFNDFLDYDESDYATALKHGFASEYLGLKDGSGFSFGARILSEYRAGRNPHPFRDAYLAGDAAAYRHMHAPAGLYPAAVMAGAGVRDERLLRLVPVAIGLLACVAAALLAWELCVLFPIHSRIAAAALACGWTVFSAYQIYCSTSLSYHSAFALANLLFLLACALVMRTGNARMWHISCVLLGACILTVEYWVLLGPAWLACLWRVHKTGGGGVVPLLKRFGLGIGILALTVSVLWPPFLIRGGFIKTLVIFAALMAHPLPASGFSRPWPIELAVSHPVLILALAIGLVAAWKRLSRDFWLAASPMLLFMVFFCLANLRVAHMKMLYAAHIVPALAVLAGAASAAALGRLPAVAGAALAACALAFTLAIEVRTGLKFPDRNWRSDIETLRGGARGKAILALANDPVLSYYLDQSKVVPEPKYPEEKRAADSLIANRSLDWVVLTSPKLVAKPEPGIDFHGNYRILPPLPVGDWYLYIWARQ